MFEYTFSYKLVIWRTRGSSYMVTEEIIVKYINYLKGYEEDGVIPIEEKLSGATINNHLTVLANFYQTLADFEVFEGQVPFSFGLPPIFGPVSKLVRTVFMRPFAFHLIQA